MLVILLNILVTSKETSLYPGADHYINGDVSVEILSLEKEYLEKDIFIIGGPEIIKQTFNLFKEFYLTRIYGNFNCDKFIDIKKIMNSMELIKKISCDDSCHFEIWRK